MKTENKNSLMVWSIVVLAIMNLSTLGTILYHQYQSRKPNVDTVQAQRQLEADSEKFSGRYFRDKLGFDGDQMDQFRMFNREFRQEASYITQQLSDTRGQMLDELEKSKPDTAMLNQMSHEIGAHHARLKVITYEYYLNIKRICTPEQQVVLKELFRKMFHNDARMGFPGHEGKKGMGKGRMNRE